MFRKMISILALLCLLAIGNFAIAAQTNWTPVAGQTDWFSATNWSNGVPTSVDWACIQPGDPNMEPIIDGDAVADLLDISPWSGGGTGSVDMNSGTLTFGQGLRIAGMGDFDSSILGPAILYVHSGTITTNTAGSQGLTIGIQFGRAVGRVIMYGGLISVPRIALQHGDITLYGGTLETVGDSNFVFFTDYSENKIDISGGTLKLTGSDPTINVTILTDLITAGHIYSSRGILGSPVFDVNYTSVTCTEVNYCVWNPTPLNNATNVHYKVLNDVNSITLSWSASTLYDADVNHNVYFGSVYNDVCDATTATAGIFQGTRYDYNGDPCSWTIKDPNNFLANTFYYWRVDEIDVNNMVNRGLVWKFKTHDNAAYNPKPVNLATTLSQPLQLRWTPGDQAIYHRVFFGTQYSAVNAASTSNTDGRYRGTVSSPVYPLTRLLEIGANPPGASFILQNGNFYYWRIDEVNNTTTWKGPVWGFSPGAYTTIDDFEDSMSTDDVNSNWPEGYSFSGDPEKCGTALVYPHAGRLLSRDSTGKFLQYVYNNGGINAVFGGNAFTEARRAYSGGTSFTGSGVLATVPKALRIDYKGTPANAITPPDSETSDPNADTMYVAIEDTAGNVGIYLNPDHTAQQVVSWTQWYISLTDINALGLPNPVDLKAVSGFCLGFGVRGTYCSPYFDGQDVNSTVMFDNIRLYAAACVPQYAPTADLDGDCDVDINDLDPLVNDWLKHGDNQTFPGSTAPYKAPILWYKFDETGSTSTAQDSGTGDANSYVGTISNWSAMNWKTGGGRDGNNCLYLPSGRNSYVSCPTLALSFMSDSNHATDGGGITFTTWINADLAAPDFRGWLYGFIVVKDVNGNDATEIACPHHWSPSDWSANGAWAGWNKNGNPSFSLGPSMPPVNYGGRWNHWAFVKAPHALQWYCNGSLIRQELDTDANAGDPNIYGPLFPLPVSAFTIGLGGWGGNWAGYIDDFQVYDYALSADEVAYITTDGTGHVILPLVSRANINYDGAESPTTDPNQKVDLADIAIMGKQWHTQILWP